MFSILRQFSVFHIWQEGSLEKYFGVEELINVMFCEIEFLMEIVWVMIKVIEEFKRSSMNDIEKVLSELIKLTKILVQLMRILILSNKLLNYHLNQTMKQLPHFMSGSKFKILLILIVKKQENSLKVISLHQYQVHLAIHLT